MLGTICWLAPRFCGQSTTVHAAVECWSQPTNGTQHMRFMLPEDLGNVNPRHEFIWNVIACDVDVEMR